MQGSEAIRDRDFNVKFVTTGQYEMDELDYDDQVQEINPKALKILDITGKDALQFSIKEKVQPILNEIKLLKSGDSKTIQFNGVSTYKIQKSHFIDRGFNRHFVMIEELTTEILAAEKKAYGKVIRMMAHEVNNTIGAVNSILQSALRAEQLWRADSNSNYRDAVEVALQRNNNLNIFMRNFAEVVRLPDPVRKNIDLHSIIQRVTKLMEMQAAEKNISFKYNLPVVPFQVNVDEQQLEQVLINIIKNAVEAAGENGSISIATQPGINQLAITDNGNGIEEKSVEQLFSPFYSTKKDGQGIGLTMVKEILLNHGFKFSLKTVREFETVFTIYFSR